MLTITLAALDLASSSPPRSDRRALHGWEVHSERGSGVTGSYTWAVRGPPRSGLPVRVRVRGNLE